MCFIIRILFSLQTPKNGCPLLIPFIDETVVISFSITRSLRIVLKLHLHPHLNLARLIYLLLTNRYQLNLAQQTIFIFYIILTIAVLLDSFLLPMPNYKLRALTIFYSPSNSLFNRLLQNSPIFLLFVHVLSCVYPSSPGFLLQITIDLPFFRVRMTSAQLFSIFNVKITALFLFIPVCLAESEFEPITPILEPFCPAPVSDLSIYCCYSRVPAQLSIFDLNKGCTPSPFTFYLKLDQILLPFSCIYLSKLVIHTITSLSDPPVAK